MRLLIRLALFAFYANHLFHIEVSAQDVNVAEGKPAWQISTGWDGQASRATDGNRNGHYWSLSCQHTAWAANPWWVVDLQQVYSISKVILVNRADCCSERTANLDIYTVDTLPTVGHALDRNTATSTCGFHAGVISAVDEITCNPGTSGRYLVVQLRGTQWLHLCEVEVYAGGAPAAGGANVNLAVGKTSTQSSMGWGGVPSRANDGNRDSNYWSNSCQCTLLNTNPWWAVDLGQDTAISRVVMINRGDCCGSRTANVHVYTTNTLPQAGAVISSSQPGNQLCGIFPGPGTEGQVIEVNCAPGVNGRYVVVQIMGLQYLTLCEVEIYGGGADQVDASGVSPSDANTNYAVGQPSSQSSMGWNGVPARANDGNPNTNYWSNSCQCTLLNTNPWWAVDLGKTIAISRVVMFNRGDCCGSRTANVHVYTTDSLPSAGAVISSSQPGNQLCGIFPGPATESQEIEVTCAPGVTGRYVVVQIMGLQYLTLCEVEVYGGGTGGAGGGGDCEAAEALQAEKEQLEADKAALDARIAELERQLAEKTDALNNAQGDSEALATAQKALATCRANNARLTKELEEALAAAPEPTMPTAAPEAVVSPTAHRFTLPMNGIEYLVETSPQHVALKADSFCQQYGMKLAQIENEETFNALSNAFKGLSGATLSEVATGERSAVNLDRDVTYEAFNAAGWSCVTIVPDGSNFKLVSKKCQGERAILCAAVPLYC